MRIFRFLANQLQELAFLPRFLSHHGGAWKSHPCYPERMEYLLSIRPEPPQPQGLKPALEAPPGFVRAIFVADFINDNHIHHHTFLVPENLMLSPNVSPERAIAWSATIMTGVPGHPSRASEELKKRMTQMSLGIGPLGAGWSAEVVIWDRKSPRSGPFAWPADCSFEDLAQPAHVEARALTLDHQLPPRHSPSLRKHRF